MHSSRRGKAGGGTHGRTRDIYLATVVSQRHHRILRNPMALQNKVPRSAHRYHLVKEEAVNLTATEITSLTGDFAVEPPRLNMRSRVDTVSTFEVGSATTTCIKPSSDYYHDSGA